MISTSSEKSRGGKLPLDDTTLPPRIRKVKSTEARRKLQNHTVPVISSSAKSRLRTGMRYGL